MVEAPQRLGERRTAAKAAQENQFHRVRQHLDDLETRLDMVDSRLALHDTRLNILESHIKIIIRGFEAVPEFLRAKDRDFRMAKSAFIAAFMAELQENAGAETNAV